MTDLKIAYPDRTLQSKNNLPSNATFDDEMNKFNIIGGVPYATLKTSSTLKHNYIELDNGSTSPSITIDHLIISRADILKANNGQIRIGSCTTSREEIDDISGLVLWLDATSGVTVDANNLVSAWADRSTSALSAAQATAGNRPFYTRADNLANFLSSSNDFTAWTITGATISGSAFNPLTNTDETGMEAVNLFEDTSTGQHFILKISPDWIIKSNTYRASVYVAANGRNNVQIGLNGSAITVATNATFNVSTGTLVGSNNCTATLSSAITTIEGIVFYRLSLVFTPGADGNVGFNILLHDGATASYTGTGGIGCMIFGAQLCEDTDSTTYLHTGSVYGEMSGVNGFPALFCNDQTPDYLDLGNPAALQITGDITVFAAVRLMRGIDGAKDYHIYNNFSSTTSGSAFYVKGPSIKPAYVTASGGANSEVVTNTALTVNTAAVQTFHKSGTTGTHYRNGTSDGSGTSNNPASPAANTKISSSTSSIAFCGKIAEILVYNVALSGTNRAKVEAYLKAKYVDTPAASISGLAYTTLKGPQQTDYADLAASYSGTNRYVWIDISKPLSSAGQHIGKVFVGQGFDMGVELSDYRIEKFTPSRNNFESAVGDRKSGSVNDLRYRFTLFWDNVSDDKVKDFTNQVAALAHMTGFYLYTSSYYDVLDDHELVYCRLVDFYTEENGDKSDFNLVTCVFEEYID